MICEVKKLTMPENNFPTLWQTVIFRNYGYVDVAKLAKVLETDIKTIDIEAKRLGISSYPAIKEFENNGYITIIRNNWFLLPYEQICTLLGISMDKLNWILKEEDFLFVKLGNDKPYCKKVVYKPLSKTAIKKTEVIAKTVSKYSNDGYGRYFGFFNDLQVKDFKVKSSKGTRIIHGYITPCGDVFKVDSNTYLPDSLLSTYAEKGVNALFLHGMLSALSYYPFKLELCEGYKERRKELKSLINRAKKFGIKIYLYFNEPRNLQVSDFKKFPHLKGTVINNTAALCFEQKEVQDYLYTAVKDLLIDLENLGGIFTITMSEYLTHCNSLKENNCPICSKIPPEVSASKVNNVMMRAVRDSNTGAELIANIWGWCEFMNWNLHQTKKGIELLDKDISVLVVSEYDLKVKKGGVDNSLSEYTISNAGPSEISKKEFKFARDCGHKLYAKIQIACSWECACVPYVPAFDITYKHIENLKKVNVENYLLTWTLGGYPSPVLDMVSSFNEGIKLDDWYNKYYGKLGNEVHNAIKDICKGFKEYPVEVNSLYFSPETLGAANLWNLKPDNKESAMVSYAYDDYEYWVGKYGYDIYVSQLEKLLKGFKKGIKKLENIQDKTKEVLELVLYAKVCYNHFEASLYHTKYSYLKRDLKNNKLEIKKLIKKAIKNTEEIIELSSKDTKIAYEASNHYFYIRSNLIEKIVNLKRLNRLMNKY